MRVPSSEPWRGRILNMNHKEELQWSLQVRVPPKGSFKKACEARRYGAVGDY